MTKRTKIIGLAAAALCAFSAFAATTQGADQWFVGATAPLTTLAVGTNKPIKGRSGTSRLTIPTFGIAIHCTADSFTGSLQNVSTSGVVEAHTSISSGVKFTGCDVQAHPSGQTIPQCTVKSPGQANGTILTKPLTGKINTTTGAHKAHTLIAPATGTLFAEIEIGGGCSFETAEATPVTGTVEGTVTTPVEGNVESHERTVQFPEAALSGSTLKLGAFASTYIGTEEIELETAGEKAKLE